MANVPITQLPNAEPLTGTELVPIVQNGVTVRTTTQAISQSPSLNQTFLTVGLESTLPNSRYFSTDNSLTITDNGPQSYYRIGLTGAVADFNSIGNGFVVKTSPTSLLNRSIAVTNAGLSITDGSGIAGNPTLSLTGLPLSLAQTSGSGLLSLDSGSTLSPVTITGTSGQISVANGTGVSGDPTISLTDTGVVAGSYTAANITIDAQGRITSASSGTATGTVTLVSVDTANGFSGTVSNPTTTPAIAIETTVTGMIKGDGTSILAATSGVDYAPATSGTSILFGDGSGGFSNVTIGSGLSFVGGTLSATGGGGSVTSVTASAPLASSGGATPNISITQSGASTDGYLSSTDWNTFNNKGTVTSVGLTAGTGISVSGSPITGSGSITVTNTAPDQIVSLTGAGTTTISGTYPNFTITSTGGTGGGDVTGPASSTDNAITRFDGTTGKIIQNSTVTLSDTGDLSGVNSIVTPDYITFDTTAAATSAVAKLFWDDGDGVLSNGLKGGNVTLQIGTQEYARVYNDSGTTLTKGQVVYISGAQGNRIAVKLARADVEATSFGTIGLVAESIANGAEGFIIVSGALYKLDTTGLIAGASVYLSPTTAGAITTTKPQAPDQLVVLGWVERVDNIVGSIYVKVDNGYELDELHDVRITSPVSGNLLIYDASTSPIGVWKNAGLTAGTGISVTNGPGSVTVTNTAPDQVVSLTAGTGISVSGTYPSFTVTNSAPDQIVSLTGAGTTVVTGTYPNFTITSNDQYTGTVTSVSALTIGTSGTDLSSTVANSTTTPVITLNVPTASATNRGALSSTDWSTFNGKQNAYTNLTSIGSLANSTGWLYNNGSGTFSYSTPTNTDVGLGNVTNDTQTKAAIVPNTAPTAGQILVGNAGGTAYAPVSMSSDATLASTGALTLATVNSNVGSFTFASITVNAKGLITAASSGATPVTSFSAGTTGFTPNTATTGAVTLAGTLATTNGGTGLTSFTSGGAVYATSTSALTTGTLPLTAGGTGQTTAPAANAALTGFTTTATAAGTTTLTNTSSYYQIFTGSTTQTVQLPVTSTLTQGWSFHIVNNSTGNLTINSSGGNLVTVVMPSSTVMVTCILTSGTTAASWEYGVTDFATSVNTGAPALNQLIYVNNAITATTNAATVPIGFKLNTVTNNSAATLTITMTTTNAVDGQMCIVRVLDATAVAQTISWVNTENSTVTVPTTSNGSTTLPLSVGFMYNGATSKWRCIASA